MWTFHLDINEVMVRKGGKMQLSRVVQRSLFELDRLDEACQKSERYSFFRNTLNINNLFQSCLHSGKLRQTTESLRESPN